MQSADIQVFVTASLFLAGIVFNYNLVWAKINDAPAWAVARWFNTWFYATYDRLGKFHYVVALGLFGTMGALYYDTDYPMVSWLIAIYIATRLPAWFVLAPHAKKLQKLSAINCFGNKVGTAQAKRTSVFEGNLVVDGHTPTYRTKG